MKKAQSKLLALMMAMTQLMTQNEEFCVDLWAASVCSSLHCVVSGLTIHPEMLFVPHLHACIQCQWYPQNMHDGMQHVCEGHFPLRWVQ